MSEQIFLIITWALLGIPLVAARWSDEEANSAALNSRHGRHDCTRPEADVCFRFLSNFFSSFNRLGGGIECRLGPPQSRYFTADGDDQSKYRSGDSLPPNESLPAGSAWTHPPSPPTLWGTFWV